MTALANLLPCPFCGGSAKLTEVEPSAYVVECTNGICNASTNIRFSCGDDARPLVIEQWNRRASPSSSLAKLVEKWIARGYTSLPSDQMLINLHVRELQEALASPAELGGVALGIAQADWVAVVQSMPLGDDKYATGYQDAINAVARVLGTTPRAAEAVTEYRWRSVSDDLPERTGWYIGINYGVVEPLRWDGNNWHHTRVTRDLAMPSHWRPLPAPPALTPPSPGAAK